MTSILHKDKFGEYKVTPKSIDKAFHYTKKSLKEISIKNPFFYGTVFISNDIGGKFEVPAFSGGIYTATINSYILRDYYNRPFVVDEKTFDELKSEIDHVYELDQDKNSFDNINSSLSRVNVTPITPEEMYVESYVLKKEPEGRLSNYDKNLKNFEAIRFGGFNREDVMEFITSNPETHYSHFEDKYIITYKYSIYTSTVQYGMWVVKIAENEFVAFSDKDFKETFSLAENVVSSEIRMFDNSVAEVVFTIKNPTKTQEEYKQQARKAFSCFDSPAVLTFKDKIDSESKEVLKVMCNDNEDTTYLREFLSDYHFSDEEEQTEHKEIHTVQCWLHGVKYKVEPWNWLALTTDGLLLVKKGQEHIAEFRKTYDVVIYSSYCSMKENEINLLTKSDS